MKKIVFRTCSGQGVGYGHLYRCISLAKAIIQEIINCEILFIVNKESVDIIKFYGFAFIESDLFKEDYELIKDMEIDLLIVDTYNANDFYLEKMKKIAKIMLFDDNNDIYNSKIPDIILNGNIHAKSLKYKRNDSTHLLIGPEYLVMREEYWNSSIEFEEKKGVLITTGGSDEFNVSPNILKELINTDCIIRVIVGPGYSKETIKDLYNLRNDKTSIILNPNGLKNYINKSEYVITASGSTIYEVISQKSTPIIFSIANNQTIAYEYFKKMGIRTIGKYPNINFNEIIETLEQSKKNNNQKLYNAIDGNGALRVARKISKILN